MALRDALKVRTNAAIELLEVVSNQNDYTNLLVFSHYPTQMSGQQALVRHSLITTISNKMQTINLQCGS